MIFRKGILVMNMAGSKFMEMYSDQHHTVCYSPVWLAQDIICPPLPFVLSYSPSWETYTLRKDFHFLGAFLFKIRPLTTFNNKDCNHLFLIFFFVMPLWDKLPEAYCMNIFLQCLHLNNNYYCVKKNERDSTRMSHCSSLVKEWYNTWSQILFDRKSLI